MSFSIHLCVARAAWAERTLLNLAGKPNGRLLESTKLNEMGQSRRFGILGKCETAVIGV
jgi:hypothetical protein